MNILAMYTMLMIAMLMNLMVKSRCSYLCPCTLAMLTQSPFVSSAAPMTNDLAS